MRTEFFSNRHFLEFKRNDYKSHYLNKVSFISCAGQFKINVAQF